MAKEYGRTKINIRKQGNLWINNGNSRGTSITYTLKLQENTNKTGKDADSAEHISR